MRMEENSLDGSSSAIVFLQAKYPGAAVLHMLFETPDNPFIIDLADL